MAKKKGEAFEDALKKLQGIVEKLERGDIPLEESMESFAEGVRLAQFCHQKLEEAESRVQALLTDEQGRWSTSPFEAGSGEKSVD